MEKVGRLLVRPRGPKQKYNHSEIAKMILDGLSNRAIMSEFGCSKTVVWEIRRDVEGRRTF